MPRWRVSGEETFLMAHWLLTGRKFLLLLIWWQTTTSNAAHTSLPPTGPSTSPSILTRRPPGSASITRTARRFKSTSSPVFIEDDDRVNRSHSAWDLARLTVFYYYWWLSRHVFLIFKNSFYGQQSTLVAFWWNVGQRVGIGGNDQCGQHNRSAHGSQRIDDDVVVQQFDIEKIQEKFLAASVAAAIARRHRQQPRGNNYSFSLFISIHLTPAPQSKLTGGSKWRIIWTATTDESQISFRSAGLACQSWT